MIDAARQGQYSPNNQQTNSLVKQYAIKVLLGALAIVVGGFLWHWVTNPLVVSVSGTGKVSVPAEKAVFTITLASVQNDLTLAVSQVKSKVNTMLNLLETEGISADSISQSQMQVTPASAIAAGVPGHQAVIDLTVETSNVANVGELIVYLYQNGATVISQPVVVGENQNKLEDQALKEALEEANNNAKALGRKKLKFFRRAVSITQASSGQAATSTKQNLTDSAEGTTIAGETFEIVRAVNVVYEMW
jgi:uncharacterized protein YggE